MTARIAGHPDVADRIAEVLVRLASAGIDVEHIGSSNDNGASPLEDVRHSTIDLALVGIDSLRGSAADDLTTVAVLPRAEVRDVLVALEGDTAPLAALPAGTRVAVVGARRGAFLAAHRPDLEAVGVSWSEMRDLLEGSAGSVEWVIVSAIEAKAAGTSDAAVEALEPKSWLPEPGQGALALIARHPIAEATAIDHLPTRTALRTELALLDALDAPSDAALGCLAQPSGRWIRLWAAVASADGERLVRSDLTGPLDEPEVLGGAVARQLSERGYGLVTAGV